MRIKEIIKQHRRDFSAIFECEHCDKQVMRSGYDDDNFHRNVIPNMPCGSCGETSPEGYEPRTTKYAAHEVV